jgi:predicted nucleic acid-binding protein
MIVVADASPLIALSRVGRLALLQKLYGRIYVPVAVWHELVVDGRGRAGAEQLEAKRRGALADAYELAFAMKAQGWWVSEALLERLR